MRRSSYLAATVALMMLVASADALAYIGPGAGLSAFGSLFALIAALFVSVVGFIWYPIKRLIRRRAKRAAVAIGDSSMPSADVTDGHGKT